MPDREKVIMSLEKGIATAEAIEAIAGGFVYITKGVARKALELLKGQDECGWVSVKDKVPDNQRPVIVYVPPHVDETKGASLGYVGMAYYTSLGKGFWCGTDGNMYGAIGIICPPTHWMEPPKEVSGDD